jgi:hypothetical protein
MPPPAARQAHESPDYGAEPGVPNLGCKKREGLTAPMTFGSCAASERPYQQYVSLSYYLFRIWDRLFVVDHAITRDATQLMYHL